MKKYWTVFNLSWQNGFVYRLSFLLWRFRGLIVIVTVYFLWEATFRNGGVIFGYDRAKILTYVFLTLVLRSIVMGVKSIDAAGEIADGRLSNYLLKPLNYHFFWFTRDLADKLLNIIFSVVEITVLYFLLAPPLYFQSDPTILVFFAVTTIGAIFLNFIFGTIASNFSFWTPGNAWGFWFLYLVFQDFFGGVMFPLDIFPKAIYNIIMLLPFPYLLFFPINVYTGKISGPDLGVGIMVMLFWGVLGLLILKKEWQLGVKDYDAGGL
ncbi:ABC-2 family transporter protein [Candidatus Microgenomates bacterium]|nr:ABC-2 family transporter protein [Candidatus Microgenomates bacterium]